MMCYMTADIQVNSDYNDDVLAPKLVWLKNGLVSSGWAIVWKSTSQERIYYQLYNTDGSKSGDVDFYEVRRPFTVHDVASDAKGKFSIFAATSVGVESTPSYYLESYNYNPVLVEEFYHYTNNIYQTKATTKISSIFLPGNNKFINVLTHEDNFLELISYDRENNVYGEPAGYASLTIYPAGQIKNAEIASITGTKWAIVYQDWYPLGSNILLQIADYLTASAPILVNATVNTGRNIFPSVHKTDDNGLIVVYNIYNDFWDTSTIYGRIYDEFFAPVGSGPFEIKSSSHNNVYRPVVTVSPFGIINVSYEDTDYGYDIEVIEFNRYHGNSKTSYTLNTETFGDQIQASLKYNEDGKLAVAYLSRGSRIMTNIVQSTCSDVTIYFKQQGDSLPNAFGVNNIRLKRLPLSGIIKTGINNAIIDQDYDVINLSLSPVNISTQTFEFVTTFGFYESKICTATMEYCYLSCGSCNAVGNSSNHQCTSCNSNYYPLVDNSSSCHLSSEVIKTYYFNSNNFSKCSADCDACTSNTQCTTCATGTYLLNGACYKTCPVTYFPNNEKMTCESCGRYCDVCTDNTNCTDCSLNFFLRVDKTCTTDCPVEFFGNSSTGHCESCGSNCDFCSDALTCTSCSCNYFLRSDNSCSLTCPFGEFGNKVTNRCELCPLFFMTQTNDCLTACPVGYYNEFGSRECKPCIDNCDVCSNATECTLCSAGFLNRDREVCRTRLDGFFDNNDGTRKWRRCPSTCATCSSDNVCITCKSGFFFLPFNPTMCGLCPEVFHGDSITGRCESNCRLGQFYDDCSVNCSSCNDLCSDCKNGSNYCTECNVNSYTWENGTSNEGISNQCLSECPSNFFSNFSRQCKSCKDLGHFLFGSKCEDFCPEGFFKDLDNNLCVSCEGVNLYKYKDICIDTSSPSFLSLLVIGGPVSYETVDKLHYFKYAFENAPGNFDFGLVGSISSLAHAQANYVEDGNVRVSEKLFSLISTALRVNIVHSKHLNISVQYNINLLLNDLHSLSHEMIKLYNVLGTFLYSSDEYNVVISDSSSIANINRPAFSRRVSVVETGECVRAILKANSLQINTKLIIKKIDLHHILDLTSKDTTDVSDSLILEFYHPVNFSKLSSDSCNDVPTVIRSHNHRALSIDFGLYNQLLAYDVDIFDPLSQVYQDRCHILLDPASGKDTTVGFRIRNFFSNSSISCASSCTFGGLEENGYVVCNCQGIINSNEPINRFVNAAVVPTYSTINHEVIKCFPHVWQNDAYPLSANPAFWSILFIMIIGWLIYVTLRNSGTYLIENNLEELIDNDCNYEELHYNKVAPYVQSNEKNENKEEGIDVNNQNTQSAYYVNRRHPGHEITNKTFRNLSPYNPKEDNRSFLTLFKNFLVEEHFLVRVFSFKSLVNPLWVELYFFLFRLSVLFMMNALIFIDEYIDKRITSPYKDEFSIAWTREFPRTILSLIGAILVTAVFSIFTITPKSVEKEVSDALKTGDLAIIRKANEYCKAKMNLKYLLFVLITSLLNIFIWFFTISFCGIYVTSANGWVVGTFVGLCILDWIFLSIGIPLIRATLRVLSRNNGLKFLAGVEWLFWITKPFRR